MRTKGDDYNVKCPHCGAVNHRICRGVKVEFGKVCVFEKPCPECKRTVYYQANYEISVIAETFDPLFRDKE